MTQIHILIPKLLSPLPLWNKDFAFQAKSNVLSELLAASQKKSTHTQGLSNTLFSKLGLAENTELPVAHYRYQLDFGTIPDTHILCADPVNLQAGTDEIILTPASITDLSKSDAEELIETLNKHFAQDNWEFIVADSGNWYLKHQSKEAISTTPLDHARGKSIFKYLPQSETLNWHSLQNEIQMLLHTTSLNQSREMAGQLPINSLWFWGAGKPSNLNHQLDAIWGESKSQVAALAGNIPYNSLILPNSKLHSGNHIIILDSLYELAIQDQYEQWQKTLQQLETNFVSPIAKICKQKKLDLIINTCDGQEFYIKQSKSWKFWKKTSVDLLNLSTQS